MIYGIIKVDLIQFELSERGRKLERQTDQAINNFMISLTLQVYL